MQKWMRQRSECHDSNGTSLPMFIWACSICMPTQGEGRWGSSYTFRLQAVKKWFWINILSMAQKIQNDLTPPCLFPYLMLFSPFHWSSHLRVFEFIILPSDLTITFFVIYVQLKLSPPSHNFLWQPNLKHHSVLFSSLQVSLSEMTLFIHLCNYSLVLPIKCFETLSSFFAL